MNGMEELGVIQTEEGQGLAGIVIGPDGNIYYCNRIKNIVGVISPGDVSVSSQDIVQDQIAVYPNPAFSQLNVRLLNDSEGEISIYNTTGQLIQSYDVEDGSIDVDIEFLASGIYHVFLDSGSSRSVARFSKM
jgi:streptogramin lyase